MRNRAKYARQFGSGGKDLVDQLGKGHAPGNEERDSENKQMRDDDNTQEGKNHIEESVLMHDATTEDQGIITDLVYTTVHGEQDS